MSEKSHIIVTPKGYQIQSQILKETLSDFPIIQSPKNANPVRLNRTKINQSPLCSPSSLSAYALPRSGYFGPKEQHASSSNSSPKALRFFPNYLNKTATECPPRHFCLWKPPSTAKGKHENSIEIPKGKYIHHTLYNLAIESKLAENPSIHGLNRAVFGKSEKPSKEILVAETYENWDDVEVMKKSMEKFEREMQTSQLGQTSGNVNMFGSTDGFNMQRSNGFSRFGSTGGFSKSRNSIGGNENREERFYRKHMETQKAYEQLLVRFSEETKKRQKRFEENQHEAPEFIKKMDDLNGTIEGLDSIKFNEDSRYVKRLKDYHRKRFEKTWSEHKGLEQSTETEPDKELGRGIGLKSGALYHVTAAKIKPRERKTSQNGLTALKLKKKTITIEAEEPKSEHQGEIEKHLTKQESRVSSVNTQGKRRTEF